MLLRYLKSYICNSVAELRLSKNIVLERDVAFEQNKKLSLLSLLSLTPSQANVVFQLPASGGFKDIFKDNRDNRDNSWRKKTCLFEIVVMLLLSKNIVFERDVAFERDIVFEQNIKLSLLSLLSLTPTQTVFLASRKKQERRKRVKINNNKNEKKICKASVS